MCLGGLHYASVCYADVAVRLVVFLNVEEATDVGEQSALRSGLCTLRKSDYFGYILIE
jgi:hypothetical protein